MSADRGSLIGMFSASAAPSKGHDFRFKNKLYSLDAAFIELCVSLFDWATYRQTKGAVKLRLPLDHDGYLPVFAHVTEGNLIPVFGICPS